jgi:hypothetical protein
VHQCRHIRPRYEALLGQHGLGRRAADGGKPFVDRFVEFAARHHAFDEAHLGGPARIECLARDEDFAGHAPADQARQQGRLDHRGQPHMNFRHAEDGRVGSHAHVAARRDLEARAEAEAVDTRDDRLRRVSDRGAGLVQVGDVKAPAIVVEAAQLTQVGAADKRPVACPGDDDGADREILAQLLDGFAQRGHNGGGQAIEPCPIVDGNGRDRISGARVPGGVRAQARHGDARRGYTV